jgi:hypothetical protein
VIESWIRPISLIEVPHIQTASTVSLDPPASRLARGPLNDSKIRCGRAKLNPQRDRRPCDDARTNQPPPYAGRALSRPARPRGREPAFAAPTPCRSPFPSSPCGIHVDAPSLHANGQPPMSIDQVPLEWCYGDGVLQGLMSLGGSMTLTSENVLGRGSEAIADLRTQGAIA